MANRHDALDRLRSLARLSQAWPCGPNFPQRHDGPCMRPSDAHEEADDILLGLIEDPDIADAFEGIKRWYS